MSDYVERPEPLRGYRDLTRPLRDYVERPRPLRGYRELTEGEKMLVDAVKRAEVEVGELWRVVRGTEGVDQRMVAHARTVLQDGYMWLVRAITRPRDVFVDPPTVESDLAQPDNEESR